MRLLRVASFSLQGTLVPFRGRRTEVRCRLKSATLLLFASVACAAPALPTVVAFGDSITEGYGVERTDAYPAQLERALAGRGLRVKMINAGVSADTTGNALDRLNAVIAAKPRLVLVEFGGNDGLRGLPLDTTRRNLSEIVARLQKSGARVALIGMTLPGNYGAAFVARFEKLYQEIAAQYKITLIPVRGAAVLGTGKGLMQPDGIHPTAAGYAQFVRYLLPLVEKEVRALRSP